jgi:DnaK suppressor protein
MIRPSSECPYHQQFLSAQTQRLEHERDVVLRAIEAEHEEMRNWSTSDDSGIDQHMADDATALTEQEMDVTLIGNARYILSEIDDALARLGDGTYGWDEESDCWIREERLEALPWARREIEGQRRLEDKMKRTGRGGYSVDRDVTVFQ